MNDNLLVLEMLLDFFIKKINKNNKSSMKDVVNDECFDNHHFFFNLNACIFHYKVKNIIFSNPSPFSIPLFSF